MLKSYKTELDPTKEQIHLIQCTMGVCRYVYNLYIIHNQEVYREEKRFVSGVEFQKWLNREYLRQHPEKRWIKEVSSKSVKQSILNADRAFRRFFNGKSGFPKLKKKGKSNVKMYFVKNDAKTILPCERHRIKIPTLGWVKVKEKGYLPTNWNTHMIKSGTISYQAGRYYVSILVQEREEQLKSRNLNGDGLGIFLGLKEFAVTSNQIRKKNINETLKMKKLEKKQKREQRCLSRKYKALSKSSQNKGLSKVSKKNIEKQILKVQKLYQRISNIRTDYVNQCVNEVVKTKPSYIAIKDIDIYRRMKNPYLAKAVAAQRFFEFRVKLEKKCKRYGIELRIVDRTFPESKICHNCGRMKKSLKSSDRMYRCSCGYCAERYYNASLNLRDIFRYQIV